MQALVLAGGEGTRLRPLTYTTPKPVMPLAGRPFLSFMLDWRARHGVDEVILSCGFLSDAVERVLGDIYDGMRLRYVVEEEPLGTAGPVRLAYDQGLLEERLLVLNGDVLTDIDLTAELGQHERTGARATLALFPVDDTASYGVVPTDAEGRVEAFLEKAEGEPPTNRINAGAYVVEREVVEGDPARRRGLVRARGLPGAGRRRAVRLPRRGLLDRHRDARALPGGDLGPARRARGLGASGARRDRLADLRGLPAVGRPHRAAERARAPLLGRHRRPGRALGAARPRGRWAPTPPSSRACSPSACGSASAPGSSPARSWAPGAVVGEDAVVGAGARLDPGVRGPVRRAGGGGRAPGDAGARPVTLDAAAIAAGDPSGMLDDVLAQPHQLGDALWRAQSAGIPRQDLPGGLVVCGMGGSAIGGDLAAAALGDRATRPIATVRGYALEPWTGPDTLVLCASYSGDTEETLACFEAAGAAGAGRVVLTTGGKLAEAARAEGVPVIGVPAGMQPRAAVVYMTVGALECAALCGAAPQLRSEIDAAAGPARAAGRRSGGRDAPDDCEPKRIARELLDTVPVVHGAGPTAAVALRWKTQLNENAEAAAFRLRAARGRPQRDLRLGARPPAGAARRRLPRGPRPAPARAAPHRADRRRGRARRRPGDAGAALAATRRSSGCCRSCCWATWSASTWPCWRASTRRRWRRSTASRPRWVTSGRGLAPPDPR